MGIELPNGRWVQWGTPKTEKALTLLVEFGDETYKDFGAGAGPQKGQVPKPDRNWDGSATDDNSTNWHADTSPAFYQNMLFNPQGPSMTDFRLRRPPIRAAAGFPLPSLRRQESRPRPR